MEEFVLLDKYLIFYKQREDNKVIDMDLTNTQKVNYFIQQHPDLNLIDSKLLSFITAFKGLLSSKYFLMRSYH